MASSGLLTTSNPVLGGGAGGTPTSGTRSGNTTVFGTTSGTLTSQHCVKFDANLNLVDNGSNCVSGAIGSFFADPSTGNDSNDCLAATVTGGHGPCLTLQHVMNVAASYDLGGARPVVTLASGTFSVGFVMTGALRGAAFQGTVPGIEINGAGVASTIIDDNTASCGTFVIGEGLTIYAHNVKIQKTSGCGGAGSGVFVQELGYFAFDNVAWGVAGSQQIHVEGNAIVEIVGNYSITGNAPYHWGASAGGSILTDGHTITCNGVTAYSTAFMLAQGASKILMNNGTTFTSCGSVTGQRYQSLSNSVIDADGSTTILATVPGNAAGIQQSGGIYTPASVAIGSVGSVFFQSFGASAINFNSANSDTTITINAPSGYNRYKITSVIISNASQTLTTATVGLFTAAGGGGVAIVTSATAVTVSTASANTNNNMQTLTVNNQNTTSWTLSQLFFRVQTAEGAAATADVQIVIQWVS
jgi:hypothetical protein